jgi:excinuclease ABC subunit B
LEEEMLRAAESLEFERAAELRDRIQQIRAKDGTSNLLSKSENANRRAASKN